MQENQGQTSLGSKDKVETDGWTDTTDCSTLPANAVDKNLGVLRLLWQYAHETLYSFIHWYV